MNEVVPSIGSLESIGGLIAPGPESLKDLLIKRQSDIRNVQRDRIDQIHALCHEFMRDMDRAILIHEQIALLEGRDITEVNGALWPVRTKAVS